MSKVKNFLCNIPIYIGLGIKFISDLFFVFGFKLHITLGTESGTKLKLVNEAMKKLEQKAEDVKSGKESVVKKQTGERYSKLADIIKGNKNG